MPSIASVLGIDGIQSADPSFVALDLFFGRNVIMLNGSDVMDIFGVGLGALPIPLVGFEYQLPDEIELQKYKLTEYPAMNRQTIINSMSKDVAKFSITAIKPITQYNNFITNYALNEALSKVLQVFNDNCGTYIILTPWGIQKPCVMHGFYGFNTGSGDVGGQGFRFNFARMNVQTELTAKQSAFLQSLSSGAV